MKISEIFFSIQGEGKLAGVPSAFVRTSGCNLRCSWCDSPYTSWNPEGEMMSVDEVVRRVTSYDTRHVVVTGGEPLIAPEIEHLCRQLKTADHHVTIETAATVWKDITCDLASISPKLSNSTPPASKSAKWNRIHNESRINVEVIRRFMSVGDYQLKFVVETQDDLPEIDELLAQLGDYDTHNVLLMPQGVTREELTARAATVSEICLRRGFRYCPRLQIELYGHKRGT